MSVLSLSYWESDVTVTNISQSLPHIMAGKTAGRWQAPTTTKRWLVGQNAATALSAQFKIRAFRVIIQFYKYLFHDLLLRSYLYHCVWSVITAHNLTPEKRENSYSSHPLNPLRASKTALSL